MSIKIIFVFERKLPRDIAKHLVKTYGTTSIRIYGIMNVSLWRRYPSVSTSPQLRSSPTKRNNNKTTKKHVLPLKPKPVLKLTKNEKRSLLLESPPPRQLSIPWLTARRTLITNMLHSHCCCYRRLAHLIMTSEISPSRV